MKPSPIQDHPWKDERGYISARVAVRWWLTMCLMFGVKASTATTTADLIAKDLESKGYP